MSDFKRKDGRKVYQCPHCERCFGNRFNYRNHLTAHQIVVAAEAAVGGGQYMSLDSWGLHT